MNKIMRMLIAVFSSTDKDFDRLDDEGIIALIEGLTPADRLFFAKWLRTQNRHSTDDDRLNFRIH